jgi:hypothetical protein
MVEKLYAADKKFYEHVQPVKSNREHSFDGLKYVWTTFWSHLFKLRRRDLEYFLKS